MGIYDGGDITAAVMSGLLLLAVMRDKEENEDAV